MAKNKEGFLMYRDTIHSVNHLTDEQAGKLFKHVLAYVNDEDPQTEDKVILLAFEPIKQYLKRDLRKYEEIRDKRSAAGKASVQARLQKKKEEHESKSTSVEKDEQAPTDSTVIDIVSVSVSDIVLDIDRSKFNNPDEVFQTFAEVVKHFNDNLLPKTTAKVVKWLKEIDKLNRIDGHDFKKIVEVVKWARQDQFWSTNFLSLMKLRTKKPGEEVSYFDKFLIKMNGAPKKKDNFDLSDAENAEDFFK